MTMPSSGSSTKLQTIYSKMDYVYEFYIYIYIPTCFDMTMPSSGSSTKLQTIYSKMDYVYELYIYIYIIYELYVQT